MCCVISIFNVSKSIHLMLIHLIHFIHLMPIHLIHLMLIHLMLICYESVQYKVSKRTGCSTVLRPCQNLHYIFERRPLDLSDHTSLTRVLLIICSMILSATCQSKTLIKEGRINNQRKRISTQRQNHQQMKVINISNIFIFVITIQVYQTCLL